LLIGAEPIECVPGVSPVLDEQAPTNRSVSSNTDATSDMVIFFFIYCLILDPQQDTHEVHLSPISLEFSRWPKEQASFVLGSGRNFTERGSSGRTTIKPPLNMVRRHSLLLFDQAFDAKPYGGRSSRQRSSGAQWQMGAHRE
jgi:hypothetical protein